MSDFGKGFIYNLFLFAKHFERMGEHMKTWKKMRVDNPTLFTEEDAVSMWFNGAGDHFYELEVPKQWKDHKIGKLARKLQNKAIRWRLEELGNKEDFLKFHDDLEKLTRMIDKELGVKVRRAKWN